MISLRDYILADKEFTVRGKHSDKVLVFDLDDTVLKANSIVYVKDVHASMTRPQKELQGFARVSLMPGEEKKVCFTLHPSQTAFLDEDMRWKIEKGTFEVQIGSSSEDIRLKDTFAVTEDAWPEGKNRAFYALGKIR